MRVGLRLLELARASGARAIFAVGTGKGVGKSTALAAIYAAACDAGLSVGFVSIGHKAGVSLRPGTLFTTAQSLLAPSPACEVLDVSARASTAGTLLYARSVHAASYDLIGPSSAAELREIIERMAAQSDVVLVDGAIDRLATLASSDGAIVLSCGAAAATTAPEAVAGVAALSARLRVPAFDAAEGAIDVAGALTATAAAALIASGEVRQIVVGDASQIVMSGTALAHALTHLRIRCRRPLHVVATTVCAIAPERGFEPGEFLRRVADATRLPAFDVFAGKEAA